MAGSARAMRCIASLKLISSLRGFSRFAGVVVIGFCFFISISVVGASHSSVGPTDVLPLIGKDRSMGLALIIFIVGNARNLSFVRWFELPKSGVGPCGNIQGFAWLDHESRCGTALEVNRIKWKGSSFPIRKYLVCGNIIRRGLSEIHDADPKKRLGVKPIISGIYDLEIGPKISLGCLFRNLNLSAIEISGNHRQNDDCTSQDCQRPFGGVPAFHKVFDLAPPSIHEFILDIAWMILSDSLIVIHVVRDLRTRLRR